MGVKVFLNLNFVYNITKVTLPFWKSVKYVEMKVFQ